MNDCFWCIIGVCECKEKCEAYLSVNSWKCEAIEKRYLDDVEKALKPIKEKYKEELFENIEQFNK